MSFDLLDILEHKDTIKILEKTKKVIKISQMTCWICMKCIKKKKEW